MGMGMGKEWKIRGANSAGEGAVAWTEDGDEWVLHVEVLGLRGLLRYGKKTFITV